MILTRSPECSEIEEFLMYIFCSQSLTAECGIMATAYIERLLCLTGLTIHATNWRRIVIGALTIASKVWDDRPVYNADFVDLNYPQLNLEDLNMLEREYLAALQYTVTLRASVFAKYYFNLRSLSEVTEENFPLKPLTKEAGLLLESRSRDIEQIVREKGIYNVTSKSLDPYKPNQHLMTLSELRKKYAHKYQDE